ncbi:dephospho-CoA kinase [Bordetella holmesii]|uniref:Dephospho-CoA kinase n=2 Tax=Bordetella holmesii TaxID=35814 RepID=A0A158M8E7_9BORD|nr:dephospho-CoA kinase [Bordetella holmesii]AHV93131.1 dephospho-CoA kinase [Bordetella holmesii ATCC 51541]AIT26578.1 dephospho-CoA kinase [Bordetella holmesii 44057]EWM42888.1 dephospho-CoA kinase [Bordetella holmesii 41130]EWM47157.1 dephospho-CoA kinase [Bordetella holmesii 35009]EWM51319.1 dephospho-CoA kinase [Bordetella holmesii 70147]
MLKIGLTGGIGSGKTRVADMLGQWGACVIDTDAIAHALTQAGGLAMPAILQEFGPPSARPDGAMDRDWMRARVFRDPSSRARLEAILHPLIGPQTQAAADDAQGSYLVFVVPLLVESGRWRQRIDRICVVDCDPDTQIARVQQRSGLTESDIRRIMAAQAARSTRLEAADDVINNDGSTTAEALLARTRRLHERYLDLARMQDRPGQTAAGNP